MRNIAMLVVLAGCSGTPSSPDPDMSASDLAMTDLQLPDGEAPDLDTRFPSEFDLDGKHYALSYVYYSVAGTVPMTSDWLLLSDKPCGATGATRLTVHAYPFAIAGMTQTLLGDSSLLGPGVMVGVSGKLTLDADVVQLPIDYNAAVAAAAKLTNITGRLSVHLTSTSGASVDLSGTFDASHCAVGDNL